MVVVVVVVPAHLGSPGKRAVKRVCVCVCVSTRLQLLDISWNLKFKSGIYLMLLEKFYN